MNTNILIILTLFVTTNASWIQPPYLNLTPKNFSKSDSRIVGGVNANIADFPHQVSIQKFGSHICGGSIISKNWIITAAHCVQSPLAKFYKIRSGSTFFDQGGTIHSISSIISHDKYDEKRVLNDIALIEVKTHFKLRKKLRRAIKLGNSRKKANPGTLAYVTGWGVTEEEGAVSKILQKVKVPIISGTKCASYFGPLPKGQICAGYEEGGRDSCQGDSGGPLSVGNLLVGIVSWGLGCAKPRLPGVYAEISYYRDWIKEKSGV
ncbi:trypsin 3A1-like isoform X3 [Belonocnema kinseyi]|uniref:trypsin 3A1-like isoform X3 n=1 Tax=Belonocnema kinseyi TaxID=2817044 RepID=UPI00143D6287|nr:trypsin 3A1-like isoform X3 [Belonocnema kinseyi]